MVDKLEMAGGGEYGDIDRRIQIIFENIVESVESLEYDPFPMTALYELVYSTVLDGDNTGKITGYLKNKINNIHKELSNRFSGDEIPNASEVNEPIEHVGASDMVSYIQKLLFVLTRAISDYDEQERIRGLGYADDDLFDLALFKSVCDEFGNSSFPDVSRCKDLIKNFGKPEEHDGSSETNVIIPIREYIDSNLRFGRFISDLDDMVNRQSGFPISRELMFSKARPVVVVAGFEIAQRYGIKVDGDGGLNPANHDLWKAKLSCLVNSKIKVLKIKSTNLSGDDSENVYGMAIKVLENLMKDMVG